MALNDNYNIANLPTLDIPRSKFTKDFQHLTTFNTGELVPIFVDELLPGTTVNLRTNKLVRLQTLLNPIFSNIYCDTYFFFVPARLLWTHWKNFMGENTETAWYPQTVYSLPKVNSGSEGFEAKSVADHFGIPTGVQDLDVNALPLRAYALIWNEFFRDENLSDPINIYMGDDTVDIDEVDQANYINYGDKGCKLLKVAKYKDVFTTALPAPQKGPTPLVPANLAGTMFSAVRSDNTAYNSEGFPIITGTPISGLYNDDIPYLNTVTNGLGLLWNRKVNRSIMSTNPLGSTGLGSVDTNTSSSEAVFPVNLWADFGDGRSATVDINHLRLAFATQRLLERDARYGTRYTEILQGHFGLTSPDARLQRPEFLGGSHFALNIDQVIDQSGTTDTSVLGETGAYSVTADSDDTVSSYSALEHGYIIGLATCRYEHSYPQGLDKMWSRTDRLSFYWPELSNIGEVGITNKEIYAEPLSVGETASDTDREDIFGYQEAWYDYRTKKSYVSGEMRSNYSTSLDSWHLADDYDSTPVLSNAWILEDGDIVNRVLAVSNNVSDQIFADFFFEYDYVAPMPLYSTPGLVDIR